MISTSRVKSAKAGRVCRSCGVCQLLPLGTAGRGEMMRFDLGLEPGVQGHGIRLAKVGDPQRRGEQLLDFLLYPHPLTFEEVDDVS